MAKTKTYEAKIGGKKVRVVGPGAMGRNSSEVLLDGRIAAARNGRKEENLFLDVGVRWRRSMISVMRGGVTWPSSVWSR